MYRVGGRTQQTSPFARSRAALLALTLAAVVVATFAVPHLGAQEAPASRVVIVLAPYLTWDDITPDTAPTLYRMAGEGAVGNLNVNNRNRDATPDAGAEQGALTLSSGAWAALPPGTPGAYSVGEPYQDGTAAQAYARFTGIPPETDAVVFLGMPRVVRQAEEGSSLAVEPGTLGGEIVEAGGATAALGNSDSGRDMDLPTHSRPAALVAMDYEGRVRFGDVSPSLLRDDVVEPYGVATDLDRFATELARTVDDLDAHGGPGLLVLDPGDLARAESMKSLTVPDAAVRQHARAVYALDRVAEMAWDSLPDDGLLLVVPPVDVESTQTVSGLAPAIAVGNGMRGLLTSSSTQRPGLVTNMDVAATALDALGIERPVQILGDPVRGDGDMAAVEQRVARLVRTDATAVNVDTAKPAVINTFIALTLVILIVSTIVLLRAGHWRPRNASVAATACRVALLGTLSVPPASLLMFAFDGTPDSVAEAVGMFAGIVIVLWALAVLAMRYLPLRVPVAVLSVFAAALMLLDQWIGAPWSFTSFLGYSPILAARYYGIGNEGAAMLFGASLVGVAFLFDQWPGASLTAAGRRWFLPVFGAVVVGTCAAPFLGANVGVAAWGIVGFAVAWALMNGHRVSWRLAVVAVVLVVIAVAGFSVYDLAGGEGTQTHLGRAWQSAGEGGAGELWLIVVRKAETNLRVLTRTNWSFVLIGMLAFLGFMRWRPQGDFASALDESPHFSAAMAACLIGGLAAYFTEDSGIVIPALIVLYVGVGILYLMLSRLSPGRWAPVAAASTKRDGVS